MGGSSKIDIDWSKGWRGRGEGWGVQVGRNDTFKKVVYQTGTLTKGPPWDTGIPRRATGDS